jgi:hypothetical protein
VRRVRCVLCRPLAFLGGVSLAGAVSSLVVGVAGLGVAAAAAGAYIVVRGRRGQTSCSTDHVEPVPIATPSRTIPSG